MDQNAILVKYTYTGDANLDGRIDAVDYFRLDQGFLTGARTYRDGDFDYSGRVDANDYSLIDLAFLRQGDPLLGTAPATPTQPLAMSLVKPDTAAIPLVSAFAQARTGDGAHRTGCAVGLGRDV